MINFLELVKSRISIRQYTLQEVEDDKLKYILECARLAPSAVNHQPWQFWIVKSEEAKHLIQQCYSAKWFSNAPVYIIAFSDTSQSWKRSFDRKDYGDVDIAIAIEHICLAATEQGLGTCWVCNFDVHKFSELLNIPENLEPIAIIPIGYTSQETSRNAIRKSNEEIIKII